MSIQKYLKRQVPGLRPLLPQHAYAADGIKKIGREAWDQFYSFGFVRNPWARLVSWYSMIIERPDEGKNNDFWQYVRMKSKNFEEFVVNCTETIVDARKRARRGAGKGYVYKKSFAQNQADYFTDEDGKIAVTFVGRFERLQADFDKVLKKLGLPPGQLPQVNATKSKDYKTYYNDRTKSLVAERFKKDIDCFGYTFTDG